jgi:hypothetical protein
MCSQAERAKADNTADKNPKKADNSSTKPACRPTGLAGALMGGGQTGWLGLRCTQACFQVHQLRSQFFDLVVFGGGGGQQHGRR